MRRNQYEEALFRCEDDRFEADVILETTQSAIAQLELLLKEIQELGEQESGNYRLKENSLSAVQEGAIRRIYNFNGIDKEVLKVFYSFDHSIIQSFNHSIIHSIIQSFDHSFNHSIIQSFDHSIIH